MQSFESYYDEHTNTLELYAMLLVESDEQPEAKLEWYDQMYVEHVAIKLVSALPYSHWE